MKETKHITTVGSTYCRPGDIVEISGTVGGAYNGKFRVKSVDAENRATIREPRWYDGPMFWTLRVFQKLTPR
jgi:hypothetical protein